MKHIFQISVAVTALCFTSCGTSYQRDGTLIGAGLGAATGAIVGSRNNHELEGAAVGGLLGALVGNQATQSYAPYRSRPVVEYYRPYWSWYGTHRGRYQPYNPWNVRPYRNSGYSNRNRYYCP